MKSGALGRTIRNWRQGRVSSFLLAVLLCASPWVQALAQDAAAVAAAKADQRIVAAIRSHAQPIAGKAQDYDALVAKLADKRFVLLGEDTHGTEEIYRERARITQRLIEELDFDGLVVESDFSAMERANAYLLGAGTDRDADTALGDHSRFPRWMWRNRPFAELLENLRALNSTKPGSAQVFGMDLHDMNAAARNLLRGLRGLDASVANEIEAELGCLAGHEFAADVYRAAVNTKGQAASCEPAAQRARERIDAWLAADAGRALMPAAKFSVLRNFAQLAASEAYSRIQVGSNVQAWNHRDRFLAETAFAIAREIERDKGRPAKLVLWAHNLHLGDARATDRGSNHDYLNLGQVVREHFPQETWIIGFTTRLGTVRAAPNWGEADRVFTLRRPAWESVPALFGRARIPAFWLALGIDDPALAALDRNVALRAIGVVYWPHAERREHYFRGHLRGMFDAVVHIDRSRALVPVQGFSVQGPANADSTLAR